MRTRAGYAGLLTTTDGEPDEGEPVGRGRPVIRFRSCDAVSAITRRLASSRAMTPRRVCCCLTRAGDARMATARYRVSLDERRAASA
jgi:hypothetical protein